MDGVEQLNEGGERGEEWFRWDGDGNGDGGQGDKGA